MSSSSDTMSARLKAVLTPSLLRQMQDFWFLNATAESCILPKQEDFKRWFMGGEALDKECINHFLPCLEAIRKISPSGTDIINALEPLEPLDWLNLILLLDQIPRNCYRGSESSIVFTEFDPVARDISLAAIKRGIPDQDPQIRWRFSYRNWFYMPLMHSESLADHELAVQGFQKAVDDVDALAAEEMNGNPARSGDEDVHRRSAAKAVQAVVEGAKKLVRTHLGFEQKHYDIVKQFGRYPHRNKALGRAATDEERAYLENGGETFGG